MTYILTPPTAQYASQVWSSLAIKGELDILKRETFGCVGK